MPATIQEVQTTHIHFLALLAYLHCWQSQVHTVTGLRRCSLHKVRGPSGCRQAEGHQCRQSESSKTCLQSNRTTFHQENDRVTLQYGVLVATKDNAALCRAVHLFICSLRRCSTGDRSPFNCTKHSAGYLCLRHIDKPCANPLRLDVLLWRPAPERRLSYPTAALGSTTDAQPHATAGPGPQLPEHPWRR